jgi:hypothetical protein
MKRNEESLKAVISLLREAVAEGTLEPGQTQVLAGCISDLCRARRGHDPARIWGVVDRVARAFLRLNRR